jgi:hypothetical protein
MPRHKHFQVTDVERGLCPPSDGVVRCAAHSGAAKTTSNNGRTEPLRLRGSAMFDTIELVHCIEHRHDILDWRSGLNIVNRIENEPAAC